MKTRHKTLAFLSLMFPSLLASASDEQQPLPRRIQTCMEAPPLKMYKIDTSVNPFYLRGDFDGDGKPDLAVTVLGPHSKSPGLVMCQGNGQRFVLGAGSVPPFSKEPDDNFLSSDWEVVTLSEFHELLYDPKLGASAKGEVIALIWEDGTAYIYWDGNRYRWFEEAAGGNP